MNPLQSETVELLRLLTHGRNTKKKKSRHSDEINTNLSNWTITGRHDTPFQEPCGWWNKTASHMQVHTDVTAGIMV